MISTQIIAQDLIKIYGVQSALYVYLQDVNGNPLPNKQVTFTINGVSYNRTTNTEGMARLNINLEIGVYSTTIRYAGDATYAASSKNVTVTVTDKKQAIIHYPTVFSKTYGDGTPLQLTLYDQDGRTPLPNKTIKITINGVTYNRTTNSQGGAKLNINLQMGEYRTVVDFEGDSEYKSMQVNFPVRVKVNTFMDAINITKMEDETAVYQCAVYDPWTRIECDVNITVNGVTYTRHTGEDGLARLNIRLGRGEYDITAEFLGDNTHNGSKIVKHISSKPYMESLTNTVNGKKYPGNNLGFMESKIIIKQYNPNKTVSFFDDMDQQFHVEIPFTNYEITETDPRVKTAKFTTNKYIDLTNGQAWVFISSPYHENFGGRILKIEYDRTNNLYTYQCQDGRRQYQNKFAFITNEESPNVYECLQQLLLSPLLPNPKDEPVTAESERLNHKLLSGLRPIDAYDEPKLTPIIKGDNLYKATAPEALSYDSAMDKIMNYANYGMNVDVHFTPEGICQIEPVDLDTWLKSGFKITHNDLTQYKYDFDTTNILTGINVQTPNEIELKSIDDRILNEELRELNYYFGGNIGMVSPVTEQVTTEGGSSTGSSTNTASGIMSGSKTFAVGCDNINGGEQSLINQVVSALQSKGHKAYSLGVGPNVSQSHGMSGSSSGTINIFIAGGICAGTVKDYVDGIGRYYNYDHMIMMFANCTTDNWISCNALKSKKQVRAHDDGFSTGIDTSITPHEMFEQHSDKISYIAGQPNESFDSLVNKLVNGQFNCGGGGGSTGTSTTTTTVVNLNETYEKALDEVSKSVRDLLNFEIKLPLNHTMFKNLHTNQMLWTELPAKFKLVNLEKIFKIMHSYKVNRGVPYLENRWYIEKISIKCDSSGLFATLTLNPFPSSKSVYSNAMRSYRDAYDQAFKQPAEEANNGNASTGVGSPRLGNDSLETGDMACATSRYWGYAGDNENFDSCAQHGYAREGKAYYDWARQFNSPLELAKAMANRFSYHRYWDNQKSVDTCHNNGGTIYCNCYDACRLVKVCFDAAGFDAVVITGSIYQGGHGWNAVKHNGRWYTFDLTYASTGREWQGTNSLRLCDEW